ncbi:MAG: hypothetical protein GY898_09025 [Proteobacteria bacterium]|nr:hypothetical protein [Pseudomonadota bacterium]
MCGCTPQLADDDDDDATIPDGCVEAGACDLVLCDEPSIQGGYGFDSFVPIDDGGTINIGWGDQGGGCGYHIWVGAEARGLCPIVFLKWDLEIGGELALDGPTRHVGMSAGPDDTRQFWGERLLLPVGLYPDDTDPDRTEFCPDDAGGLGPLDLAEDVVLITTVTDHDDRTATHRLAVDPVCCE